MSGAGVCGAPVEGCELERLSALDRGIGVLVRRTWGRSAVMCGAPVENVGARVVSAIMCSAFVESVGSRVNALFGGDNNGIAMRPRPNRGTVWSDSFLFAAAAAVPPPFLKRSS